MSKQDDLDAIVARSTNASRECQERAQRRRAEKSARSYEYKLAPPRDIDEKTIANATTIRGWFLERLQQKYGAGYMAGSWTIPQRTLAKRLLKDYGEEMVARAVTYMFDEWEAMVRGSKGRLRGEPTINLLWGMREQIIGDIQRKDARKDQTRVDARTHDEYKATKTTWTLGDES